MKKKLIIFVLMFTLIFELFINTCYKNYTYAVVGNALSDEMFKSTVAPLLVGSGLVFYSNQALNDTVETVDEYFTRIGLDYQLEPEDPQDPNSGVTLGEALAALGAGKIVYDFASGGYKKVIEVKNGLFNLIKSWVSQNSEQLIIDNTNIPYGAYVISLGMVLLNPMDMDLKALYFYDASGNMSGKIRNENGSYLASPYSTVITPPLLVSEYTSTRYKIGYNNNFSIIKSDATYFSIGEIKTSWSTTPKYNELPSITTGISTVPDIINNPDYDWNNTQTGTKTIVIPIETDTTGYPIIDNPLIGDGYMVDVQPEDIPTQDTTGTPYTEDPVIGEPTVPEYPVDVPSLEYDNSNKRNLLQTKFPFSLPWDIKKLFVMFSAPAEAPRFDIDVVTPELKAKIGITKNTKFVFDMADFPLVGRMSRFFTFIGFILGLIILTRTIIRS